jgi:hypothetical protein
VEKAPRTDFDRWGDELVEYLEELGGSSSLHELYEYIEAHPKRELRGNWEERVRFTLYEHSSDSDIWKRGRDLFTAVDGKGSGVWGLRQRMPKHYLQYWKPSEINAELARQQVRGMPLSVIAGKQLRKVVRGDTVWIVSIANERRLTLYAKVIVDNLARGEDEVVDRIGHRPSYKSPIYALARNGTEPWITGVDLSPIASSLRFDGKPDSLVVRSSSVSAQQLQSMRLLRPESARLLEFAWRTRSGHISRYERNVDFRDPDESEIDENQTVISSKSSGKHFDAEARIQAADRRIAAHWDVVCAIKKRAVTQGYTARKTRYIDVVVYRGQPSYGTVIIEVKSLEEDDADQTRRAIGQLMLYRFLHRRKYGNAGLVAAFNRKPTYNGLDLTQLLGDCGIGTAWCTEFGFDGTSLAAQLVPWLIESHILKVSRSASSIALLKARRRIHPKRTKSRSATA